MPANAKSFRVLFLQHVDSESIHKVLNMNMFQAWIVVIFVLGFFVFLLRATDAKWWYQNTYHLHTYVNMWFFCII